ncbi:MAG: type II secretion system protein GspC [Myxococcaceae bacterium]
MELFFRKYFWTVNLVFLALVALLLARTANQFVEAEIAPGPQTTIPKTNARPQTAEVKTALNLDRLAKLTGLPVPKPEPEVHEPTAPVVDLNAEPVRTSLRVKLLGTLVAGDSKWSIASIQDVVTQKTATYMVDDLVQNAKVLDIERERVIVLNNNRKEFIDAQGGTGEAPAAAAYVPPPQQVAAQPAQTGNGNLGAGIKALSENEYEVPRAEIDKTLSNLNDVAMQARIVPAFQDGVAKGFKLFSIRPDSIYSKIGVQNGDVIRRINGYDLNSPEKALEIYSKLKEASRIDIEIERNGSVMRKTYNVR